MAALKRKMRFLVTAAALACGMAIAEFPAQDMGVRTLGVGLHLRFRGQNITKQNVPSYENIEMLKLGYAPWPYLMLYGGLGFDRFSVDTYDQMKFSGNYGFAPAMGGALFTPFMGFVRLTAGAGMLYMRSEDDEGYRYSAFIFNPHAGLSFSLSPYVDLILGGRGHFIDGYIHDPINKRDVVFGTGNVGRMYVSLMVKSPAERAFLNLDFDASPEISTNWSKGPAEASVGLTVGFMLAWKERKRPSETNKHYPAYSELKKMQDEMAEELQ